MITTSNIRSSTSRHSKAKSDEDLWEKLKIHFRIELRLSENEIIGCLRVEPEEASKMIKHFVFVTNKNMENTFDRHCRRISIIGHTVVENDLSAYIEAIPKHNGFQPKRSNEFRNSITQGYSLPKQTIDNEWILLKNFKYALILRWAPLDISDDLKCIYVLRLDEKEIHYIGDPPRDNIYQVRLQKFDPGTCHKVEVLARLKNGEIHFEFKPLQLIVPDETTQFTDVTIDLGTLKTTSQMPNKSQTHPQRMSTSTSLACGCLQPHDKFLGVSHYSNFDPNQP